ncbi:armadillo-type protein [Scheffersomyces coipomensis]|uniref:armadillo-type protein n=1 Tax=Scheffersomyces coipomensis TaxID=1788519 RepID=UPI00315D181F
MVDPNLLLECFAGTLEADPSIRMQAESNLKQLSISPGFLGACLDIISLDTANHHNKIAPAVYFKNKIVRFWNSSDKKNIPNELKIQHDEKPYIRDRILPVMIHIDYSTKQQLIPALRVIIAQDFEKWPNLLNETGNLLQEQQSHENNDEYYSKLYTGLLCFAEITRKFKWVENSDRSHQLDPMIIKAFPHLLNIGNSLILTVRNNVIPQNIGELISECLKLILKIFKFVTYYDLPEPIRDPITIQNWIKFHNSITNIPTPNYILQLSSYSEQEKNSFQISKCYKWSIANMFRIFSRYAYANQLSKKFKYKEFQKHFNNEISSPLINFYLAMIENWCHEKKWLNPSSLYYVLEFLSQCIIHKQTWVFIKPYYDTLIKYFIYPILCPTDEALELFEIEPQQYISIVFDINDEFDSPDIAALGFLVTLIHKRSQTTLGTIVSTIYNELNDLQNLGEETLAVVKKKEGILRMFGNISDYLIDPKLNDIHQLKLVLFSLILPNLNSKFEFIRARVLDILCKFSSLEYTVQDDTEFNQLIIYQGILNNFNQTTNLVLNFESSLAIQAYINHEKFKPILSTMIVPIMSKLLELSNEIDNDSISVVMQECVENFSEQLQPFGIDLMAKLVEQLLRLCREIVELNNQELEDGNDGDDDYESNLQSDKIMVGIGLLNTMITILLSFENSQSICLKLEETFYPVVEYIIVNKLDDLFGEVGELIENSIFLLRFISPNMWKCFELLYQSFVGEDGISLMYIEELFPTLQNFLIYSGVNDARHESQIMNDVYKSYMIEIIHEILLNSTDQISEFLYGIELGQTFILSINDVTKISPIINESNSNLTIKLISTYLQLYQQYFKAAVERKKISNSNINVNLINIIVSGFTIDYYKTLVLLTESGEIGNFFDRWFKMIPILTRVYDIKLHLISIINLMNGGDIDILNKLGDKLIILIRNLPRAMNNLDKKRKNLNGGGIIEPKVNDIQDESEGQTNQYLDFLQTEDSKIKNLEYYNSEDDDDEDELIMEDPLVTNPLDNIDILLLVKTYLQYLHQNDGQKFTIIFGQISDNDKLILENLIMNK